MSEWLLSVEYDGDRAEVYRCGRLIDDWFTTGETWHMALKRFGCPDTFTIRIYDSKNTIPCTYGQDVYYDLPVRAGCEIRAVRLIPEYETKL